LEHPVSTLAEWASSHGSIEDHWGNTLETKKEETVWIVFQNIAGLAQDKEAGDMKLELAHHWITKNKIDILVASNLACVGIWLSTCSGFNKRLGYGGKQYNGACGIVG